MDKKCKKAITSNSYMPPEMVAEAVGILQGKRNFKSLKECQNAIHQKFKYRCRIEDLAPVFQIYVTEN